MKTLHRHLPALLALVCSLSLAQTPPTLYEALGGEPGVAALVDGLIQRATADARIRDSFKDTNLKELAHQLRDQFCTLTGGPCRYEGDTMQKVHAGLHIDRVQFNALVEDLQAAMDACQLPFSTQNRLLALLAPMHREIITR